MVSGMRRGVACSEGRRQKGVQARERALPGSMDGRGGGGYVSLLGSCGQGLVGEMKERRKALKDQRSGACYCSACRELSGVSRYLVYDR